MASLTHCSEKAEEKQHLCSIFLHRNSPGAIWSQCLSLCAVSLSIEQGHWELSHSFIQVGQILIWQVCKMRLRIVSQLKVRTQIQTKQFPNPKFFSRRPGEGTHRSKQANSGQSEGSAAEHQNDMICILQREMWERMEGKGLEALLAERKLKKDKISSRWVTDPHISKQADSGEWPWIHHCTFQLLLFNQHVLSSLSWEKAVNKRASTLYLFLERKYVSEED